MKVVWTLEIHLLPENQCFLFFAKIYIFISVNCVWMDHKSEITTVKEIKTVPTFENQYPTPRKTTKPTLLHSLADDKIVSLALMTSLFMNTANLVKDELSGLTRIPWQSTTCCV